MAQRTRPKFTTILDKYPDEMGPCDQGREKEWDQCAIRTSIALIGAGFHLTGYKQGPTCKHGHARGAQSLGDYLWTQWGRPKINKTAASARATTRQKTGIIVFKDIAGFRGGRGDHIDLWNQAGTITGEYFDRAKETWFWEIP